MTGSAGQKRVPKSYLLGCPIPVPNLNTQDKVIHSLRSLRSIIELRRAQLMKLDELVKCRFVELFAQGFPIIKLGNVFETCSGGTPSSKNSDYYDGGNIPWLTSGEVNKGIIYQADSFITLAGLENSSAKWIPADSVVVAMYGATAGKVGLVKYRTTTNQAVCSILPHADYHPLFLYYAVQQQENWMLSQVVGGAQQNLSQQIVRRMEIPSPPYSLQIEFANYASRIDKLRFVVETSHNHKHFTICGLVYLYANPRLNLGFA
jgi:restriction endonuclease S subunit